MITQQHTIAGNPENQLGFPIEATIVLQNTFCDWETVKRVDKEEPGQECAIPKPLLTSAVTSSKQESWECSWVAACSQTNHGDSQSLLSPSHSKHKVESLSKITKTTLGFPPCLPVGPSLLSERMKAEMEARFYSCWPAARTAANVAKMWTMVWLDGGNTFPHFFFSLRWAYVIFWVSRLI